MAHSKLEEFDDTLLRQWNDDLEGRSAVERVGWVLEKFPGHILLSTSFGVQAAVMLHLVTQIDPKIPVVFIDTGYLFPETYHFAAKLIDKLGLNPKVSRKPPPAELPSSADCRLWH